jgi:hypothetical protein
MLDGVEVDTIELNEKDIFKAMIIFRKFSGISGYDIDEASKIEIKITE